MKPFDLQVNGYAGIDFCALSLTGEQLHYACQQLKEDGVASILATVITDTVENLETKLAGLTRLREADPLAREMIAGFHIEGPFLNPAPGFAGAHPPECMRQATVSDAERLLDAAGGLTRLVTLAPEQDPGFAVTGFLAGRGVTVSAGHCDPSLDQLRGAIDHGLSMVTHFGNGCPVVLPRHDNVLQRFLHFRDRLWFCFIPDGHHVPFFALENWLDFVGIDRAIMVTDAIAAAKLPPGRYQFSGMEIEVDASGAARRPGSPNLAGSTVTMPRVLELLKTQLGLTKKNLQWLVEINPAKALSSD